MTTAIFLLAFFIFMVAALNWLPVAVPANSSLLSSWAYFIGILKAWNWIFPVTEMFVCIGIVVAYEILKWTWFKVLIPILHITRGTTH